MRPSFLVLFVSLLVLTVVEVCKGEGLRKKFYHKNCSQVEEIVRNITWNKVAAEPSLAAKLLRLHYHDCFVRGCDASILLDSAGGNTAEKEAIPNLSLSGYEIIDEIKAELEEECPGTVSCADIVALTARDAVSFQFGRPMWKVFTGRRDGSVSLALEATRDLPSAAQTLPLYNNNLQIKGSMLRILLLFRRLYNFTGNGDTDPSLDPAYANFLKTQCSNPPKRTTTVEMDPKSSLSFDTHYFKALKHNQGLFQSDAALLTDKRSAHIAKMFQNRRAFIDHFGHSMVNMGAIGVLNGDNGEIRKNCRVINA
uniref:Peroxidase n=1 Tax=Fagus sylvatica TaxID=28930 RepID=A0A2N9EU57_FAGSY